MSHNSQRRFSVPVSKLTLPILRKAKEKENRTTLIYPQLNHSIVIPHYIPLTNPHFYISYETCVYTLCTLSLQPRITKRSQNVQEFTQLKSFAQFS